jgi:hypothetical protein
MRSRKKEIHTRNLSDLDKIVQRIVTLRLNKLSGRHEMAKQLMATVAGMIAVTLMATAAAHATPCPSTVSCLHAAPAPLLAAGIPAFAALTGGVAVRQFWRRFTRRS